VEKTERAVDEASRADEERGFSVLADEVPTWTKLSGAVLT
jgi:hypothetical protein